MIFDPISGTMILDPHVRRQLMIDGRSRPNQEVLYLSTKQIEYIIDGEVGSSSAGVIENQIEEKIPKLPSRFQRLINDITILKYGGFLDETDDLWEDMIEIRGYAAKLAERRSTLSVFEDDKPEIKMGYDIGLILSMLSGSAYERSEAADLLWGILLAYCTPQNGQLEDEKKNMEVVYDELEERRESHFEYGLSHVPMEERTDLGVSKYEEVTEFYEWCEIEVTPTMRTGMNSYARESGIEGAEETERFIAEHIESLIEEHDLTKMEAVRLKLNEEWDEMPDILAKRVETKKMLKALWDLGASNSREVAREIDDDQPQQVTEAFNKLAENGKRPAPSLDPVYKYGPLVEWVGDKWKFTDYGCLVYYHTVEKDQSADWIYTIARHLDDLGNATQVDSQEFTFLVKGSEPTLVEQLF